MTRAAQGLACATDATLVILDLQTQAAALLPRVDADRVCAVTGRIVRAAQALAVPIIYTEHCAPPLGAIDPRIANVVPESAYRVAKNAYCAWVDDEFCNAVEIAARRQIVLCGLQAHISVVQTAIAMAENGYRVFTVADGIGSHDPALAAHAIERMRACSVTVTSSESLLYEWLDSGDATVRDHVLSILQEN